MDIQHRLCSNPGQAEPNTVLHEETQPVSVPVHNRCINIASYDLGNLKMLHEGRLTDFRYRPGIYDENFTGAKVVHDFRIRLVTQGPELSIQHLTGEMIVYPHPECIETLNALSRLNEMKIKRGFSEKLRKILGGTNGCVHINNLVLNLVHECFQGYFSAYSRLLSHHKALTRQLDRLVDTCYVWRKDGSLVANLQENHSITVRERSE